MPQVMHQKLQSAVSARSAPYAAADDTSVYVADVSLDDKDTRSPDQHKALMAVAGGRHEVAAGSIAAAKEKLLKQVCNPAAPQGPTCYQEFCISPALCLTVL